MVAKTYSAALHGLNSYIVEVQVDVSPGFPSFTIVGLPDTAIQESKERIRAAIKHAGIAFPDIKVVVNLAPADLPKEGPSYDLPIALAILAATKHIRWSSDDFLCVGELSLDGQVRATNGVLSMAMMAKQKKFTGIIVPFANAAEAALVANIIVLPAKTLLDVIKHCQQEKNISVQPHLPPQASQAITEHDFSQVKGHATIKRALEIVAAGGHHILLFGPPGAGKTILAKTLVSILPVMSATEILEVTQLYSIAGLLSVDKPIYNMRPFRQPHHSASMAALVGGGRLPRPGEISLAQHGVLYLDELTEFQRSVIEALRQPLEERTITVARVEQSVTYPANCIFIGSLNPCPCGYFGDGEKECVCTPLQIANYQKKLSGPLLDRIDLFCFVPRINFNTIIQTNQAESSQKIQQRVSKAYMQQQERYECSATTRNATMTTKEIEQYCNLNQASQQLLRQAMQTMQLSPRGYHRILRVARTIADLEQQNNIATHHISEALHYRQSLLNK